MGVRIFSGAAVAVISFLLVFAGGLPLLAALLVISCIAYRELTHATGVHQGKGINGLEITGYLIIICYYGILWLDQKLYVQSSVQTMYFFGLNCVLLGGMMLMMAVYVFTFPKFRAEQVMTAFFELLYAPVMLSCIYLTRSLPGGLYVVWMIFISSWVCDTCAYFTGVAFGRHKMAPILSPKKSIEGAIGGIVGSAVFGALFGFLFQGKVQISELTAVVSEAVPVIFAAIAAVGAVISQIGDLAASAIKRNHEIKDYGKCIPGHGGIMDRFDSVIFTAPVIYALAVLVLM